MKKSRWFLALHQIYRENGTSFLDHSSVRWQKQNQCSQGLPSPYTFHFPSLSASQLNLNYWSNAWLSSKSTSKTIRIKLEDSLVLTPHHKSYIAGLRFAQHQLQLRQLLHQWSQLPTSHRKFLLPPLEHLWMVLSNFQLLLHQLLRLLRTRHLLLLSFQPLVLYRTYGPVRLRHPHQYQSV